MIKVSGPILRITLKSLIQKTTVFGMTKMAPKKEKEKAQYKSKYSNRNSKAKAKSTGLNKKLQEWQKSQAFLKVKYTNGAGTKRKRT